jgi:hypothetical protein
MVSNWPRGTRQHRANLLPPVPRPTPICPEQCFDAARGLRCIGLELTGGNMGIRAIDQLDFLDAGQSTELGWGDDAS